mmetsp:Transcript_54114/g.129353  ORF Transcript_54114/g.129353 Transcript_54114/m.129353 type:complete len:243 (-) Transcript_54114:416-1144(-)
MPRHGPALGRRRDFAALHCTHHRRVCAGPSEASLTARAWGAAEAAGCLRHFQGDHHCSHSSGAVLLGGDCGHTPAGWVCPDSGRCLRMDPGGSPPLRSGMESGSTARYVPTSVALIDGRHGARSGEDAPRVHGSRGPGSLRIKTGSPPLRAKEHPDLPKPGGARGGPAAQPAKGDLRDIPTPRGWRCKGAFLPDLRGVEGSSLAPRCGAPRHPGADAAGGLRAGELHAQRVSPAVPLEDAVP